MTTNYSTRLWFTMHVKFCIDKIISILTYFVHCNVILKNDERFSTQLHSNEKYWLKRIQFELILLFILCKMKINFEKRKFYRNRFSIESNFIRIMIWCEIVKNCIFFEHASEHLTFWFEHTNRHFASWFEIYIKFRCVNHDDDCKIRKI